jgi:hypothetical protein
MDGLDIIVFIVCCCSLALRSDFEGARLYGYTRALRPPSHLIFDNKATGISSITLQLRGSISDNF